MAPWIFPTFCSIILASIFPIIAADTLKTTPPFITLALTFLVASIVLLGMIITQKKWKELKNIEAWKYGLWVGLLNGVCFYGFYYSGLLSTTPGNASLIAQTEVIFAFLFFQTWKKESFNKSHILGAILLIAGALYLLSPKVSGWNVGDFLILAGMAFAPLGNYLAKKARTKVSSTTFLFMRYACTVPFCFLISYLWNESYNTEALQASFGFIALMGIMMFVIKNICWMESIRHVTVTRVLSLHGFAPFLTLLILWIFRDTAPTMTQLVSGIPMLVGVLLLCRE